MTCFLVLADGTVFKGNAFGSQAPTFAELSMADPKAAGELVFNTGMTGYPEIATDPSYTGQLVVMTYPHIGNYGVDDNWFESKDPNIRGKRGAGLEGMIVRSLYCGPVPGGRQTLNDFFKNNGISGITEIDTRALTLKLRDEGSCNAVLVRPGDGGDVLPEDEKLEILSFLRNFPSMEGRNLVDEAGTKSVYEVNKTGTPHFVIMDCGIKENIIRRMTALGCRLTIVPSSMSSENILNIKSDGVLVSNGPGDPAVLKDIVLQIKNMLGKTTLTGICLGHQLICLALGAVTEKMVFGHHGINHPVREVSGGRVFITSQNHGFTVKRNSLTGGMKIWLENSNDNSIEGIRHDKLPILTAQFHPESAPGPNDSDWIFDAFIRLTEVSCNRERG